MTPDVELVRMRVEKKNDEAWINLQNSTRRRQESDYEWHLVSSSVRTGTKPEEVVSYLYVPSAAELRRRQDLEEIDTNSPDDDDESDSVEPEEDRIDFPIDPGPRSARAGSHAAPTGPGEFQQGALRQGSRRGGPAPVGCAGETGGGLEHRSSQPGTGRDSGDAGGGLGRGPGEGGEPRQIRGTVKNVGTTTVYRVRAVLKSDNPLFDENEMVFGKIAPGTSKTYDFTVKAPKSSLTRTDVIRAEMSGQGALTANSPEMTLNIEGKAHPLFAYSYQTIDDVAGNRDGQVQRGERVRTLVKVKNIGQGAALRTEAILRNGSGQEGILISAGRFESKDLPREPAAPSPSSTRSALITVGTTTSSTWWWPTPFSGNR